MRFDYGTQLNPNPIPLSIGTLKKPTLNEISALTFDKFNMFEAFLKMTPERFFTKFKEDGQEYWDSLSEERQDTITMYDLLMDDPALQDTYVEIFDFFFVEPIRVITYPRICLVYYGGRIIIMAVIIIP